MPLKRGSLEDAEGLVPQDPRDMAKTRLSEAQSSGVLGTTLRYRI